MIDFDLDTPRPEFHYIKTFLMFLYSIKINAVDGAGIQCECPQQVESGRFGKAAQRPPP
jgi:hypothetical protein